MTEQYAVIGNPIAQSKSPLIHAAFAAATGQAITYGRIEGVVFARDVDAFRAEGGKGLNVTAPFKLEAFDYATIRHERARQAGAANCLLFDGNRVEAENFDGIGLLRDIEANLGVPLAGRSVLLLGAGGAARGAVGPLLAADPARLVVANRTRATAIALAEAFGRIEACDMAELAGAGGFDIVINATSADLNQQSLALPDALFAPDALAYDMIYGRGMTSFLRLARASGVTRLHDGVGMLVEQAAEAFAWWRGVRPATAPVIQSLTIPLG